MVVPPMSLDLPGKNNIYGSEIPLLPSCDSYSGLGTRVQSPVDLIPCFWFPGTLRLSLWPTLGWIYCRQL